MFNELSLQFCELQRELEKTKKELEEGRKSKDDKITSLEKQLELLRQKLKNFRKKEKPFIHSETVSVAQVLKTTGNTILFGLSLNGLAAGYQQIFGSTANQLNLNTPLNISDYSDNLLVLAALQNPNHSSFKQTEEKLENRISLANEFVLPENDLINSQSELDRQTRIVRKSDHKIKNLQRKLVTKKRLKKITELEQVNCDLKTDLTNLETQNSQLSVRPDISAERYNELLNQEKRNKSFQTQLQTRHQQIAKQIQQKREFCSELKVANQTITSLEERIDKLTSQPDNRPNITLTEHNKLVKQIVKTEQDNYQHQLKNYATGLTELEEFAEYKNPEQVAEIEKLETARDSRPNITLTQYEALKKNQKPLNWEVKLKQIPRLEEENRELKTNQTTLENNFKKYKEEYKFKEVDITKEDKYEKEQTEHGNTTDKLTKSNSENEERIKKLGSNVADLAQQIRDAEVEEGKLQTELHQLGEKNIELTEKISELNTVSKKEQTNLKILQTRVENRGKKITELSKRPDITEIRYNKLLTIEANQLKDRDKLEIVHLKAEIKGYKKQRDIRPDISFAYYQQLLIDKDNALSTIEKLQIYADLQTNLTDIKSERDELKEQILTEQREHNRTKVELSATSQKIEIAEKFGAKKVADLLDSLKGKLTNSEEQLKEKKTNLNRTETELTKSQVQSRLYQGQISQLENNLLHVSKIKEQQVVKISEQTENLTKIGEELQQRKEDYRKLAEKLAQAQQDYTQSENSHSRENNQDSLVKKTESNIIAQIISQIPELNSLAPNSSVKLERQLATKKPVPSKGEDLATIKQLELNYLTELFGAAFDLATQKQIQVATKYSQIVQIRQTFLAQQLTPQFSPAVNLTPSHPTGFWQPERIF
ncbi:13540_t:CDS:10 [Funneliformis geosporum]|uniref:13540_t:CDS:1 n=1 Tax=Funneliformis geosporum TaxID=1117311 RepID=A0A9W4SAS2_9GLOM|nr:13540_t:CDS:10 [Funneliformis geosporum]